MATFYDRCVLPSCFRVAFTGSPVVLSSMPTSAGERADHILKFASRLLRSELCRVNTEQSTRAVARPASLRHHSALGPITKRIWPSGTS